MKPRCLIDMMIFQLSFCFHVYNFTPLVKQMKGNTGTILLILIV